MTAERVEQRTPSPRLFETGELPPILRDPSLPTERKPFRPVRFGIKTVLFVFVFYFFILPLIPGFRHAAEELLDVEPVLLVCGIGLQVGSWWAYAFLTRAALGDARHMISPMRMFRIGMSSKALTYIVPAGNAAGSALGYRLLTLSGVRGADAGFAMATAGIGSAVVLNVMLWLALLISIPIRGANGLYAIAAVAGVVVMMIAVGIVVGLIHGQSRAERIVRAIARKFRWNEDKATAAVRQVGTRVEDLIEDKQLLRRVISFAALAWVLDAASLWVFLRAFGGTLDPDALFVAFGLANVIGVIPITPGRPGDRRVGVHPDARRLRVESRHRHARRRCVPHQPVLPADRRRRRLLRVVALRPVEASSGATGSLGCARWPTTARTSASRNSSS